MSQDLPATDETVRYRSDAPAGRPSLDGVRPAAGTPRVPADDPGSAGTTPERGAAGHDRAVVSSPDDAAAAAAADEAETARLAPTPAEREDEADEAETARLAPTLAEREDAADDTRPVTRDWQLGAPEAADAGRATAARPAATPSAADPASAGSTPAAPSGSPPEPQDATTRFVPDVATDRPLDPSSTEPYAGEDDFGTQRLDLSEPEPEPGPGPGPPPVAPLPERGGTLPHDAGARTRTGGSGSLPPLGEEPPSGFRGPGWRRRAVLVPAAAVALLGALYGVDLAVAQGEIPRSTVVAGVDVGGLSPAAAASTLERDLAPVVAADHAVAADDVQTTFSPVAAGLTLDVQGTVDAADDQPLNPWTRFVTVFAERDVRPVIVSDDTALAAQIENIAAQVDRAPEDATIAFEGTTPSVVDAADGRALDREGAADAITEALMSGRDPATPIELPVEITPVSVGRDEAERVLQETVLPAVSEPVAVVSEDGATSAEVPVAAIAAAMTFTPEDTGELVVGIDPEALKKALGDQLRAFGTPPKDAEFQISGSSASVVPSVDGTGVDPAKLAEQLLPVLADPAPRSVTAELGPVPADFTTEEAQALGIKERISTFTTRFANPASGTNIRVVAAEVDGAVVMPGETFSLNGFTGPRGTAQGYVEAAVIQHGELSKAVGGGISQFATTMFNAMFFAGLEDVFHKTHSFYISRYPAGREATVYEGAIDLQWRNDGDTGVYIDTTWTPDSITVAFYGTKRYEIQAIEGPRTNPRQPTEQEKVDDGNCTPQPGVPGFDVKVTRVFRDLASGEELRRETFSTRYAAEAIIRCIPPAEPAPATPSAEPTPSTPGG